MSPRRWPRLFAVSVILGMTAGIVFLLLRHRRSLPVSTTTQPTTLATKDVFISPTTQPAVSTYVDIIRHRYPDFPATRPFDIPVDLSEAGHVIIDDPVYICSRGDLWITRTDGPSITQTLTTAGADTEHVVSEPIFYVHWDGDIPALVTSPAPHRWELVDIDHRRPIPWRRDYHWQAAFSWTNHIIVPADQGVSIITVGRILTEDYQALYDGTTAPAAPLPQFAFDTRGILTWIPPDHASPPAHVARYVDDHWSILPASAGWNPNPVQLVPLLDGSVLQFVLNPDKTLDIQPLPLESAQVNPDTINALIDQLGDDDPARRSGAFAELSQYGPGIWPLLQARAQDPIPDISTRITALLSAQRKPTLGGLLPVAPDIRLINRYPNGGMILYSPAGVTDPFGGPDQTPITHPSAWLCLDPGQPPVLLPAPMTHDLDPAHSQLLQIRGEWISLDSSGPRRFLSPSTFAPLLRPSEQSFSHLLNIDRRGRWLFQRPGNPDQTLIIDPTLPDPTPRLMVWLPDSTGAAGCDRNLWPVQFRNDNPWLLNETGWAPVDPAHDPVQTVWPKSAPNGPLPILMNPQGNTYLDGLTQLIRISPDGTRTTWPLPPEATADTPDTTAPSTVRLIETHTGLLYLFNSSARVIRIRPTPQDPSPFRLEAIFTNGIPPSDNIDHIWLDPADRIDIIYHEFGKPRLAILFADGEIPPELQQWILPRNLRISGPQ